MKHRLKQGVALLVTGLAVGNFANRNEGDTPPVTTSPSQAIFRRPWWRCSNAEFLMSMNMS